MPRKVHMFENTPVFGFGFQYLARLAIVQAGYKKLYMNVVSPLRMYRYELRSVFFALNTSSTCEACVLQMQWKWRRSCYTTGTLCIVFYLQYYVLDSKRSEHSLKSLPT